MNLSHKTKRILSLISAFIISSLCGTQYLFSSYSTSVADRLGFSSVQINTIGSSANYGLYLSGPVFGYISDNYPSRIIPMLASVTIFTGYFCFAMTYQGYFESKSFILCAFYMFLTGVASSAAFLSALGNISANVKSFRGIAFGILLALFGLTALIFSQINSFFFKDTYHFLLFIAITTGTFIFTGSIFLIRLPPEENREDILRIEENSSLSPPTSTTTLNQRENNEEERTPLLSRQQQRNEEVDIGGWELFRNTDALLLGFVFLLIGGIGLMYINNIGTIVKSLYIHSSTNSLLIDKESFSSLLPHENIPELQKFQNLHVTLISITSSIGRIGTGLMSDLAKYMYNFRRLWFLLVSGLFVFIGQIWAGFIIIDLDHLWISTIFVSFGYGNLFGIFPIIISEWFGKKNFGLNWGFITWFPAFGGQLFNFLFGYNFDLHKKCSGVNCYNSVFYISAIGCILSICIISGLLIRRTHIS